MESPAGDGGAFSWPLAQPTLREKETVKRTIIAAVMLVSGATAAAVAEEPSVFLTTGILRQYCESVDTVKTSVCAGYIEGIADLLRTTSDNWLRACVPAGIGDMRLLDIVSEYMRKYPGRQDVTNAALAVSMMLRDAFPCKR
jgi:hypothetical protein